MSVPSIADVWQCIVLSHCGGFHAENVFHVAAPTLSDPDDVAQDCADAWSANSSISKIQSHNLKYDGLTVQPFDGSSAPISYSNSIFDNDEGQAAATQVSPQVALVITKRTLTSGRSHRGRFYIAGMRIDYLDTASAQWDSSHATAIQDCAIALLSGLQGGSVVTDLLVYSPFLNSVTVVSSLLARISYLGTQRPRAEQFQ
jgi:hypothetical protein